MNELRIRNISLGTGRPKICVPLSADSPSMLEKCLEGLRETAADIIEFRADIYEDDPAAALERIRDSFKDRVILFTIRTAAEGGKADLTDEDYIRLNLMAASKEADLLDIEYRRFLSLADAGPRLLSSIKDKGCHVVGSFHDFEKTPRKEELTGLFTAMQKAGFSISKIAVMPENEEDVLELMQAAVLMKNALADRPYIAISMGSAGMISRCACSFLGSCLTFGSQGKGSAPGQIPAGSLRTILDSLG